MSSAEKLQHREKVQRLCAQVRAAGEPVNTAAPWSHRLAWKLGWCVKPPLFQAFGAAVAIQGALWLVTVLATLWLTKRWFGWAPLSLADLVAFCVAAPIVGGMIASRDRAVARRMKLPSWRQY